MGKHSGTSKPQWAEHQNHLFAIARAALDAVDPFDAVRRYLQLQNNLLNVGNKKVELQQDARIYVVGAGKAGVAMAKAVEQILGERIYKGLISVPNIPDENLSIIRVTRGGHPLPTQGSIQAGKQIRALLDESQEKDLVIALISGGGSALLELPSEGLQLTDLQKVNDLLIKSGAPIQDINIVRRQLSQIKGGGLARMAAPARTIALILSDVVGDSLEAIASGPTTPSTTGQGDAWQVLERYKILSEVPDTIQKALYTPDEAKEELLDPDADRVTNIIIGSNTIAAEAAVSHAEELGFRGILLTTELQGEAREVGKLIAGLVKAVEVQEDESPVCIVLGGETTVTVQGSGIGGRNQEFALAAAIHLEDVPNIALMTLATDGIDGPTPSAGAIVSGHTITKGRALGLEATSYLRDNASYTFFNKIGDTVTLGPTGTNVNDLVFCLIYSP